MADHVKALIDRLNDFCRKNMEAAAGSCVNRGHYEVTVEHLLHELIDDAGADIQLICRDQGVDVERLRQALDATLEGLKIGNSGRPVFSPRLMEWFSKAWMIASLDHGHADIRSGVLLIALIQNAGRLCGADYDQLFETIDVDGVNQRLDVLVVDSHEQTSFAKPSAGGASGQTGPAGGGDGAIARFCTDFTAKAREGRIDPVFGRDAEIRQMVDILARRRKNNPICVGEPGVGKTAVVEGLALRVAEGDVPDSLQGVTIVGLDLGLLQAGASVKGEFEKRLQGVLDEVKSSPTPVILFIDEAHTLIGAGGSAGTGDAANLLKPALARGEMKTVAATTWAEYKKYFEKDAALARRFQLVKLDEPGVATTVTMLRGLRGHYEAAHQVVIRDDALVAAAEMGARYISGRQHPDKGIDLIDTGAARVKVALASKPAVLQDAERLLQEQQRTLESLKRDRDTADLEADDEIEELEREVPLQKDLVVTLTEQWQAEKKAADRVIAARLALREAGEEPEADGTGQEDLRAELDAAKVALAEAQGDDAQIHIDVTAEVIARVVADWTGVPVGNMVGDEAATLLKFESLMKKRLIGQDHAMDLLGTGIRASKAGLKDPRQPMGVFLLVGPSGVGKTETAIGIADLLFGGEGFMSTVNMSEFQEKHAVSRLVGTSAGYVGFGEGGVLTESVRQRPYSVVLLDEVEKAHLDVMNIFYQVFDKGILSDGEGREIDFANTCVILTSNLATDLITQYCTTVDEPDMDELLEAIRPTLSAHFKPALLARMTIIPFFNISTEALKTIARLKMGKLQKRVREQHRVELVVSDEVINAIAERCTEVETGARNVDHIISNNLMPDLANEILSRLSTGDLPERIGVELDAEGGFAFDFGRAAVAASDE
ncbi:MAG: type VI secretion system ATPase TssH [Planctomycetota bacterium]|jgi:type VI secretion system protein VasG|nr:type VI secretion system ATPase TssH [Planctomycetota bacterium]